MKRVASSPPVPLRIALLAYPGVQGLDLSGPLELFSRANQVLRDEGRQHPGYAVSVLGTETGPMAASSGFRFLADATWCNWHGPIDTLLVIGGLGMRRLLEDRPLLAWLRRTASRVRRYGAVCTGSFVLAEAGLLDGRRVCTHWTGTAELAARYPRLHVEPDRLWVRDGNIVTSAGVGAGMDLTLALIEEDLGADVALALARMMVLYVRRPGDSSQYSQPLRLQAAKTASVRDLVAWASEHPNADLSVSALAQRLGRSERQLTRIFRAEVGVAPGEAVEQVRVEVACRLLADRERGLEEVATHAGFGSAEVMRRTFLRALRVTPSVYRQGLSTRGAELSS